jgi:hypothetical protein
LFTETQPRPYICHFHFTMDIWKMLLTLRFASWRRIDIGNDESILIGVTIDDEVVVVVVVVVEAEVKVLCVTTLGVLLASWLHISTMSSGSGKANVMTEANNLTATLIGHQTIMTRGDKE